MLKKSEVITILNEGGYIYMKGQPQSAYVYSVSDKLLGRCRHDMAQRLAELDQYEAIPDGDGGTWCRICDPVAVNAEKAAAWHELDSIRTPGTITIKAKNDCRIGGNYVAEGRTYRITVYGDGTQSTPGNAYGKLYDFRADLHAVHFEIIERPAEEPQQPQSDPLEVFERAGVISDLEITPLTDAECAALSAAAAEETAATQEAPAQQRAAYLRADGEGATHGAAEALSWHRAGHDLLVCHHGRAPVYVHGAPQEPKRTREDENRAHCKHIAEEIDAYAAGELKRCPECGEIHRRDWDDIADVFRCPECGAVTSVDDWDTLSLWEFFDDAYDIEYRCDSRKEYRSVRVMIACGGPNIYVDTASKDVELYWWTESARYPISYDAAEIIDEWAAEYWGCM